MQLAVPVIAIRKALVQRPSFVMLGPAAVVAFVMTLPLAYLALRSLGSSPDLWDLLFRQRTAAILLRTVLLVATVTLFSVAISLPLAWLTVRTDLPLRRLWAVLTSLPLVIPSYVGGFLLIAALGPKGTLQGLLEILFGLDRLPSIYGFHGAAITLVLLSYPYVLLTLRAALWRLDPSLEEASLSMGNRTMTTFWRVVVPQLRPAMGAGALLVALYTLSDFGAVSLLRYETFTWAIYVQYEGTVDRGLASALSLVLVMVALVILLMEYVARGKARYHRSMAGAQRVRSQTPLGRWRWPAFSFCTGIVLMSLVIPIGMLGLWVERGISGNEEINIPWGEAWNSVSVSLLSAVATPIAAFPVGLMAVRHTGLISGTLERLSYIGFVLPSIVVALSLVFFASNYAWPLYQSLSLLVVAYVMLSLPASLGALRASLLQVSPRIEEAARSLGGSPVRVTRLVTIPLVRSGLLTGGALVFLLAMKELPATLILGPIGFKTLATASWSASSEGFFAQAAIPALMLVILAFIPMVVVILAEGRLSPPPEALDRR